VRAVTGNGTVTRMKVCAACLKHGAVTKPKA
jgi:ribosomal protein L28